MTNRGDHRIYSTLLLIGLGVTQLLKNPGWALGTTRGRWGYCTKY